jgi:hypothetical protein
MRQLPPTPSNLGPGGSQMKRDRQLWDLYSRKFFCLASAADLANTALNFFDVAIGSSYLPIGGTAGTTPQWTVSESDTNLDTPGQVPFDKFVIHGVALQLVNLQLTPGTVGGVNDLAFWPAVANSILYDSYVTLKINDNEWLRCNAVDLPGAGGLSGAFAQGTTAALTVGASAQAVTNGMALASNYLDFSADGPLELNKSDRIKMTLRFGPGMLNQSGTSVYKPSISANQPTAIRMILKAYRNERAQ